MKKIAKHQEHQPDFTGERMIPKLNKGFAFYYEHLLRYLFSTQFVKNKRVLDLGSGTGYGTRMLKQMGAKSALGIDISQEAVDYARDLYQMNGIKYVSGDVEKLPDFPEKFETVVAFELLEHLASHDQFLTGVKNNLTKNGVFLVSTPNKYNYPAGNPFHINELYPEAFEKLLKRYFKFVYLFNEQCMFSNSMTPLNNKSDLKLSFIDESYTTTKTVTFTPEIDIKKSRYVIALCSDQPLEVIDSYALDSFKADEFSLEDGVEGMTAAVDATKKNNQDLKQAYEEITSSHFFKLWRFYNLLKSLVIRK